MLNTVGGVVIQPRHRAACHCGIHTHHHRRSNPQQYAYKVGCLAGVAPLDIENVPTNDGVNHPADRAAQAPPG